MIQQVLYEIQTAQGVLNLDKLHRKLGIERTALEGMIQFLVQSGRLLDEEAAQLTDRTGCSGGGCPACAIPQTPSRSYSLSAIKKHKNN